MRIWTTICREKRYWLTIFFRETGRKQLLRVGKQTITFGKGRGHAGKLARIQIEVTDGDGSIEFFPGAKILGVVMSDEPGIDPRFQASLRPRIDEVELVNPNDAIIIAPDLARDVAGDKQNQAFKTQLEVLNGHRRTFIGK